MFISCNGITVLGGSILMPLIGTWTADLRVDGEPPAGACTISVGDGEVTFVGTALPRVGSFKERHGARIIGGAGGLATALVPRQHRGVPLRIPLQKILSEAGETLSPTADAATLAKGLTGWSRRAGSAGEAIAELLRGTGAKWRVLADGSVWIGPETWPTLSIMAQTLGEPPADDTAEIATDLPVLRPGVTFNGRRVSAVLHTFEPARIRTKVWYEHGSTTMDRLKGAFFGLARYALSEVDYHATYAATVVQQQGNGDLHVRTDDRRFWDPVGTGLAGVKLWPGVPGINYAIRGGARVLVGFLDGRPKVPIVTGWNTGTPERVTVEADRIELGEDATRGIARLDDEVNCFSISAVQTTPPAPPTTPGVVTITITPPTGSPVSIALTGAELTVASPGGVVTGTISSASAKSFAE